MISRAVSNYFYLAAVPQVADLCAALRDAVPRGRASIMRSVSVSLRVLLGTDRAAYTALVAARVLLRFGPAAWREPLLLMCSTLADLLLVRGELPAEWAEEASSVATPFCYDGDHVRAAAIALASFVLAHAPREVAPSLLAFTQPQQQGSAAAERRDREHTQQATADLLYCLSRCIRIEPPPQSAALAGSESQTLKAHTIGGGRGRSMTVGGPADELVALINAHPKRALAVLKDRFGSDIRSAAEYLARTPGIQKQPLGELGAQRVEADLRASCWRRLRLVLTLLAWRLTRHCVRSCSCSVSRANHRCGSSFYCVCYFVCVVLFFCGGASCAHLCVSR